MKKLFASLVTGSLFMMPAFAFADSWSDLQTQLGYMLAQIAALTVDRDPSCFVFTSTRTAHAGQPFMVVWGTMGKLDLSETGTGWLPYGAQKIVVSDVGTRLYKMKYRTATGAEVSCQTTVTVI